MGVGEQKTIRVNPEDAYGPINPKAFQEVPRERSPLTNSVWVIQSWPEILRARVFPYGYAKLMKRQWSWTSATL